jgi:hypothetical protein
MNNLSQRPLECIPGADLGLDLRDFDEDFGIPHIVKNCGDEKS